MAIKRILAAAGLLVTGLLLVGGLAWLGSGRALAAGETLYVAPGGDCGGATPCYASPQAAVDAAGPEATVKIAQGTYTGSGAQVLLITKAITVSGGFAAGSWVLAIPTTHPVALDGENVAGRRVLRVDAGESDTVVLSGLEFRRGNIPDGDGGGVLVQGGLVIIRDSRLQENTAAYGGGLYAAGGAVELVDSVVESNLALWEGGGLAVEAGTLDLEHNQITGNSALRHGGGLAVLGGAVVQQANRFRLNSADSGAALAIAEGSLTASNDVIADNLSPWEAVYVGGGTLQALHWTLADNGDYGLTTFGGQVALTNTIVVSHSIAGLWGQFVMADTGLYHGNGADCAGAADCRHNVLGRSGLCERRHWQLSPKGKLTGCGCWFGHDSEGGYGRRPAPAGWGARHWRGRMDAAAVDLLALLGTV